MVYYGTVLVILVITPSGRSNTVFFFGFSLINCFYTKISKISILTLAILVLYFSKKKLITGKNLNCALEFFIVLGFSILFLFFLTSTYDFFGFYLAIEGLSLTLYVLAGMLHHSVVSIEAAVKYFSLGAVSTGFLLFGISLLFGLVGSLDFLEVQLFLTGSQKCIVLMELKVALSLILFGLFFKISAFPCH
jgi:NADH-quinone oxidoreductase subunit N